MRNMSFALTTHQYVNGEKDVTRRLGWLTLKPGDKFRAVKKCMGLKPGEKIEVLGVNEVVSVRRERIDRITKGECRREGFPEMSPGQFVFFFCKHMKVNPETMVTRIEFRKIGDEK